MKTQYDYYKQILSIFIKKIPKKLLKEYLNNHSYPVDDDKIFQDFTDYIGKHIKKEYQWMTNISILETVNKIVEDAVSNGNIKI
jgi:hypothetical protein